MAALHVQRQRRPGPVCSHGLSAASLPFWLLIAAGAYQRRGLPTGPDMVQASLIALSSGVITTPLYFRATDLVRTHAFNLTAVEATQAAEVRFVLLGEVALLRTAWPSRQAIVGLSPVVLGIALCRARSLSGPVPGTAPTSVSTA